jgi:glycosyltransferase involved in cell wall biosynthesis
MNKYLHIELITETYPPEINGVALTVQALERGLKNLGHRVGIVRPEQAEESPRHHKDLMLVEGAPIPRYPGLRFGLPAKKRLRARWTIERPDAIYIATEGPLGWSAMRSARKLGIPIATGFHTRFDDYVGRYGAGFLSPWVLAWLRRFHNRADATLVPTKELADSLIQQGFEHVIQLPRAVDTKQFHPEWRSEKLRASWGLEKNDIAVLHVGRIAPEKNLSLAVNAYRALQQQKKNVKFIFVGDGPVRASLQNANPDFIFLGTQLGDALSQCYASADVFCFPSLSETFGNVTLEAMASGLAICAFDYGAAHEYCRNSEHGFTSSFGDEEAFKNAFIALCQSDNIAAYGERSRLAVQHLEPSSVANDFARLLYELSDERYAA